MPAFDELKALDIWVLWAPPDKAPLQINGRYAKSDNPDTWASYDACLATGKPLGTMIQSPYVGVDLDKCVKDGVILPWAQKIVDAAQTYTEFSPSGTGLHLWLKDRPGAPLGRAVKDNGVEIYWERRYFTYTGRRVPGTPDSFAAFDKSVFSERLTGSAGSAPIAVGAAQKIPRGTWHNALVSKAGILRNMNLSKEGIEKALNDFAEENFMDDGKGIDRGHISTIARDAVEKWDIRESAASGGSSGEPVTVPDLIPWKIGELLAATMPKRKSFAHIRSDGGAQVLTSHSINQVFAFRGTGKTMFQFALGLALAGGRDFLCYAIPFPRRVLYIEGELPDQQIQERMKSLDPPEKSLDNMFVVSQDRQGETEIASIHTKAGRGAIDRLIDTLHPEVLFLDSMSSLLHLGTNEEDSWLEVLPWLRRLRSKGICVVITQQTGKDQTRGNRGHSRAEDPLDVSIQLTRRDEECEYLNCMLTYTKFRAGSKGAKPIVITKQEFKGWEWSTLNDALKAEIRAMLLKDPSVSNNKIFEQVGGKRSKTLLLVEEVRTETAPY